MLSTAFIQTWIEAGVEAPILMAIRATELVFAYGQIHGGRCVLVLAVTAG
jgi:hypothetical protein